MILNDIPNFFSSNVDDVDPWLGFIMENPMEGAMVGETFGCVMGQK